MPRIPAAETLFFSLFCEPPCKQEMVAPFVRPAKTHCGPENQSFCAVTAVEASPPALKWLLANPGEAGHLQCSDGPSPVLGEFGA